MKFTDAPTLRAVAAKAGVSIMTVSRAFRPGFYVSKEARKKVAAAAKSLDYRPDARLSELMTHIRRSRRPVFSGSIALLKGVTAEVPAFPDTPANRAIIASITSRAESLGYAVCEQALPFDGSADRTLHRVLRARNISGVLILPPPGNGLVLPFDLSAYHAFVLGNAVSSPPIHRVMGNERSAVRGCLVELAARGYRRPGIVMHRLADQYTERAWLPEFLAHQFGRPAAEQVPPCIYPEWAKTTPPAITAWYKKHRPDVVLATEIDVLRWLKADGVRVPRDAGFVCLTLEGTEGAEKVAGMRQNFEAMGALLVEQLVGQIQRGERGAPRLVLDCFIEASWRDGPTVRARTKPQASASGSNLK